MIDKLLETLFDGDSFHKMEKMMPKKSKVPTFHDQVTEVQRNLEQRLPQ